MSKSGLLRVLGIACNAQFMLRETPLLHLQNNNSEFHTHTILSECMVCDYVILVLNRLPLLNFGARHLLPLPHPPPPPTPRANKNP